jgi:hypothetical protein
MPSQADQPTGPMSVIKELPLPFKYPHPPVGQEPPEALRRVCLRGPIAAKQPASGGTAGQTGNLAVIWRLARS